MNSQDYRNLQEAYLDVYDSDLREEQEFESWVAGLLDEGYDLSDYNWDEMYEIYNEAYKGGEAIDLYDTILSYLINEGYADTYEAAESIMVNMSEEWRDDILNEAVYGGEPKKPEGPKDTRLVVTNADKKGNTPAYQNFKKGDKRYRAADHMDEATAMAKRGLDEPAIRNKIAAKTSASGAGKFADKATALADRETYGNKEMKAGREKLARAQRGTFRDTTSSSPGLRGYGHQSSDPAVKAKQDARGNQRARAALTPNERKQYN